MPSPLYGQNSSIFAIMDALVHNRLTTVISDMGGGKSTVVQAVLYTLQERARKNGGIYMYADGVFRINCHAVASFERLYFMLGESLGLICTSVTEFLHFIKDSMLLLVLDGVDALNDSDSERLKR
jgi:hypothetical protein